MATLQYHEKSKGDKAMQIMPIIIMLAIGRWLAGWPVSLPWGEDLV
jgi:hypothetical protein